MRRPNNLQLGTGIVVFILIVALVAGLSGCLPY